MLSALNTPGAGVVSYHIKNPDATLWVGNIDQKVNEEQIWELMCQAGPIESLVMPRDKVTTNHEGYAFVEYKTVNDADYALRLMSCVRQYNKLLRINKTQREDKDAQEKQDWLVKVFIGGLDEAVDEGILTEIFSTFGHLLQVVIARDPDDGTSKGYGFLTYDTFEAGDRAIEAMNGLMIHNRKVSQNYAFKKDSKTDRHGTPAERLLAARAQKNNTAPMSSHPITISQLPHVGINTSLQQNTRRYDRNLFSGRNTNLLSDPTIIAAFMNTNEPSTLPPGLMLMAPPPPPQQLLSLSQNSSDIQPHHLHPPPPVDIVRNLPQHSRQQIQELPGTNHNWSSSYNIPMQSLRHNGTITTDPTITTFIPPPPPPLNLLQPSTTSPPHIPGQNSMYIQNQQTYNHINRHVPPPPSPTPRST